MSQQILAQGDGVTFGPFEFFPLQRRLLRDGQPVHLGARALDLLLVLVERSGRLVSKEELIALVWPDTHVEEVALRVHMTSLRKVLSDGRPDIRDLVNIPGRGYQFVSPVTPLEKRGRPLPEEGRERVASSLPAPLTRVIGRDRDVQAISRRLETARCVTVVGPGGVGKTTVGLVVGHDIASRYEYGVCFVDLAPLSGMRRVIDAIRAAAGVPGSGDMSVERLAEFLQAKDILLLIDNCEHVTAEVSGVIASLTSGDSRVRVLATSREPLHLERESVYRLPSLATPVRVTGMSAEEALKFPAIELFVERAAASAEHFTLDDENTSLVAAICSQLDGLALAIELAATRMDKFGVGDIAAMLVDRFRMLKRRSGMARHTSLSATLDWSYELLDEDERRFLHRASSFSGSFTVDDAVSVMDDSALSRGDIIECLADLVDKSFITVDLGGRVAFYRLYETMREYGLQKARGAGGLEDARRRHAAYMRALFTKADEESERRGSLEWLADYGRYIDDVRSALEWSFAPGGDVENGISLTASALPLWIHLSFLNELQQNVDRALYALGSEAANGAAREMKLHASLSYALVNLHGPTPQGTAACSVALDIARRIGDHSNQAKALLALWNGCFANGEVLQSLELAEEFMAVAAKLGHADVLVGHRMLGSSHFYLGDVQRGRKHMEIMVGQYGATSHDAHMARFGFSQLASGRGLLAFHLRFQGLFDRAMEATRISAEEAINSNHTMTICGVLGTTSIANAIYTGYFDEARHYIKILIAKAKELGLHRWENFGLGFDGILSICEGRPEDGLAKLSTAVSRADDRANTRYMFIFSEHAIALGRAGDPTGGLAAIDEILARLEGTGERWFLPELHRCRGELLRLAGAETTQIEAAFGQSLSLASEMGALNWRLRTARNFAEFLRADGRASQGLACLKAVYDAFTEGHGCPEMVQTRRQLASLGGAAA